MVLRPEPGDSISYLHLMKHAHPGLVFHGENQPHKLIPVFLRELDCLSRHCEDVPALCKAQRVIGRIEAATGFDCFWASDSDEVPETLEQLAEELDAFSPPGHHFSPHSTKEGIRYGFWPTREPA